MISVTYMNTKSGKFLFLVYTGTQLSQERLRCIGIYIKLNLYEAHTSEGLQIEQRVTVFTYVTIRTNYKDTKETHFLKGFHNTERFTGLINVMRHTKKKHIDT